METSSDEELEWCEMVSRAERENFEQKRRLNRSRGTTMADEFAPTVAKIALITFVLLAILSGILALLMPYLPVI